MASSSAEQRGQDLHLIRPLRSNQVVGWRPVCPATSGRVTVEAGRRARRAPPGAELEQQSGPDREIRPAVARHSVLVATVPGDGGDVRRRRRDQDESVWPRSRADPPGLAFPREPARPTTRAGSTTEAQKTAGLRCVSTSADEFGRLQ